MRSHDCFGAVSDGGVERRQVEALRFGAGMADAAVSMRAGQIATAIGLEDSAAKREDLRSKLKRLVEHGWAPQDERGPFTLTALVARELAVRGTPSRRGDRSA